MQAVESPSVRVGRYAGGLRMPAHADGHSRLSVVLAGGLRERAGRVEVDAGVGFVAIKPGPVVHENVFGPTGACVVSILIPDGLAADAEGSVLDQWRWIRPGPLSLRALRLALSTRRDAVSAENALAEWLAEAAEPEPRHRRGAPPAWLRRVREALDAAAVTSVRALAEAEGLHPVYVARVFRQYLRCTPSEYLQSRRLLRALEGMAAGVSDLAALALAAGFADQSHFSRDCRRLLGLPPGALRTRLV
ncbi:MAG: helix-turn-helix transcriptional regulator [Xanthomonadales bacterium]|jgi:AraC family transcriptional regulator|nr:helix-turn-helix transcriptional regulator [Xanthomonadales bacterium]